MREQISPKDNLLDVVCKMSEGNPGAMTVIAQMMKIDPIKGFIRVLSMDDMNLRGCSIWL